MQLVDGQPLYDVADGDDEIVGTSCGDNRLDNHVDIGSLVGIVGSLMQEFLDDVAEILGERFPYLRARVLARYVAADTHQLVDGDMIPVVDVFLLGFDNLQFLFGIVD